MSTDDPVAVPVAAPRMVRCDACNTWVVARELHICTAGLTPKPSTEAPSGIPCT